MLRGQVTQRAQELRNHRHSPLGPAAGLQDHRRDIPARQRSFRSGDVVVREHDDFGFDRRRDAARARAMEGVTVAQYRPIVPAMEVPFQPADPGAASRCSRQPQRHECRFGTRGNEPDALGRWHQIDDPLRPPHLGKMTGSIVGTELALTDDRVHNRWRRVPQHQRAMAHPVVNQFVAVEVVLAGA